MKNKSENNNSSGNKQNNYKQVATDSIISNLKETQKWNQDGNLIQNFDETGSFKSINNVAYGIEVDVDDL